MERKEEGSEVLTVGKTFYNFPDLERRWIFFNEGNFLDLHIRDSRSIRSSHSQMFCKIAISKNFAKPTEQHLCWSYGLAKPIKK